MFRIRDGRIDGHFGVDRFKDEIAAQTKHAKPKPATLVFGSSVDGPSALLALLISAQAAYKRSGHKK